MAVQVTLFIQQGFCLPVCFSSGIPRSTDGEPLLENQGKYLHRIERLMEELHARYGDAVRVDVKNSWGLFTLFDVVRLKITPRVPTWVVGRRKICEGVPGIKVLAAAIDEEIRASSALPGEYGQTNPSVRNEL